MKRGPGYQTPGPPLSTPLSTFALLGRCGLLNLRRFGGSCCGLLNLLLALHIELRAYLYRATPLDLYVLGLRTGLDDASLALGVAGVGRTLDRCALVGVITLAGNAERLIDVPALGLLLALLAHARCGPLIVALSVCHPIVALCLIQQLGKLVPIYAQVLGKISNALKAQSLGDLLRGIGGLKKLHKLAPVFYTQVIGERSEARE